jgi:hypothetical protein
VRFPVRLAVVFLLALAVDILGAVHVRALVGDHILTAAGTIVLISYLGFLASLWFVEERSTARRLWLVSAEAWGAGLGTLLVISLNL